MSIAPDDLATSSIVRLTSRRTAADWLASLGDVPLHRIIFDPLPGTATEEDVLRLDAHEDCRCELVDGTLVQKTGSFKEGIIEATVGSLIGRVVWPAKLGVVCSSNVTIWLRPGRLRSPDISFYSMAKHRARDEGKAVPAIVPDLAVEVLSDDNTQREMTLKLAEYFEAGTRLVWYVDPRTRTVDVYTSPTDVTRLTDADTLTGGEVLPGFECRIAEFFAIE